MALVKGLTNLRGVCIVLISPVPQGARSRLESSFLPRLQCSPAQWVGNRGASKQWRAPRANATATETETEASPAEASAEDNAPSIPSGMVMDPTRVMINGLPRGKKVAREEMMAELKQLVAPYGIPTEVEVAYWGGGDTKPRGFAFVTMSNPEVAQAVIKGIHNITFQDRVLKAGPAAAKEKRFKDMAGNPLPMNEKPKSQGRQHVKLYVGNLWPETTKERLREVFSAYGTLVDTKVVERKGPEDRTFGFVTFSNEKGATAAIEDRDGSILDDYQIRVNVAQLSKKGYSTTSPPEGQKSTPNDTPTEIDTERIVVRELPFSMTSAALTAELEKLASQFGVPKAVEVVKLGDGEDGRHRGHAFITLESPEQAEEVLKGLEGVVLDGKTIKPKYSSKKKTTVDPLATRRVVLLNLPYDMAKEELIQEITKRASEFGTPSDIEIAPRSNGYEDDTSHRGVLFMSFSNISEAQAAIKGLSDTEFGGRKLKVLRANPKVVDTKEKPAKSPKKEKRPPRAPKEGHVRIYVGNLAEGVTPEKLKELFAEYGEIVSANVNKGEGRRYGFVTYNNEASAVAAIEARNGAEVDSNSLVVSRAKVSSSQSSV